MVARIGATAIGLKLAFSGCPRKEIAMTAAMVARKALQGKGDWFGAAREEVSSSECGSWR